MRRGKEDVLNGAAAPAGHVRRRGPQNSRSVGRGPSGRFPRAEHRCAAARQQGPASPQRFVERLRRFSTRLSPRLPVELAGRRPGERGTGAPRRSRRRAARRQWPRRAPSPRAPRGGKRRRAEGACGRACAVTPLSGDLEPRSGRWRRRRRQGSPSR